MSDTPEYTRHSVTTDALTTLGTIIGPFEQRDAVHIAVFPVQCGEQAKLRPGDHCYIGSDGLAYYAESSAIGMGIVDPFIEQKRISRGEWFWLMVYPRQITSLAHVWEHPAFPPSEAGVSKAKSEAWLRNFCSHADCPEFEIVVQAVTTGYTSADGEETGEINTDWGDAYVHFRNLDAHAAIPPEFWKHMSNYTGKRFDVQPASFSCSC
jgi:hypothetical protein